MALLPLYPYGRRRSVFSELIPGQLWSLEQLQGVYYVAVPVRLTVAKVPGGLMLVNPLPPTGEGSPGHCSAGASPRPSAHHRAALPPA